MQLMSELPADGFCWNLLLITALALPESLVTYAEGLPAEYAAARLAVSVVLATLQWPHTE